jgi:YHS domain-containing protein
MDKQAQWALVAAAWVLAIGIICMGLYAIYHFSNAAPVVETAVRVFGTAQNPICPVDGDPVVLGPDTPSVNYNGNTYYFCGHKDTLGRDHKMLFLMDPMHYLTGSAPLQDPGTPGLTPETSSAAVGLTLSATDAPQKLATPLASPVAQPSPQASPVMLSPTATAFSY